LLVVNIVLERELTRKRYLESLENRTQYQKDEEEALYIELKRMEQRERQFRKSRDELLRTLGGINSGLPDIVCDESPFTAAMDIKRKKKGGFYELDSPSTPSVNTIALPPPAPTIKRPPAVTSMGKSCSIE
jgi:DNA methyltransferase 1-associated protein 1